MASSEFSDSGTPDFFKAIFTHSPTACLFFGSSGILDCNEAAIKLLGAREKDEVVGKHPSVFSPEMQPDGISSQEKSMLMDRLAHERGTHVFEWVHRKVSGEEFPVEVTLTYLKMGEETVLLTQWRDLTQERKAAADQHQLLRLLKSREEYFRSLFDNSPLGILELTSDLKFISANRAYFDFIGYTEEELRQISIIELTHPEDRAMSIAAADAQEASLKPIIKFRKRYIHKDGRTLWAEVSAKFVRTSGGAARFLSIISDVTAEKEREFQMREIQSQLDAQESKAQTNAKFAALGQMAGNIAHEINNPLAIIRGKVNQVRRKSTDERISDEEFLQFIDSVSEMSGRMEKIVKGLTIQSRSGKNDPLIKVNFLDVFTDILPLVEDKFKRHEIELIVSLKDAPLLGSRVQLGQVLMNILNNAFDAVSGSQNAWVKIELSLYSENLKLEISNSGPKIGDEIADSIMQPLFTTKAVGRGTGLGLSISKNLIEAHEGQLALDRDAHHTKFVITLPLDLSK